jgi:alkylation response protein AidB-like acyl-CoA dehydrogenase
MDLLPTPEQELIVAASAKYLGAEMPVERLRRANGSDALALWPRLAEQGWFAMTLPESVDGGGGLGIVEEALVHRELGRYLAPPAVLGASLGARVATAADLPDMVARIVSGTARVGLASLQADGGWQLLDTAGADLYVGWTPASAWLWAADVAGADGTISIDPAISVAMMRTTPGVPVAQVPASRLPLSDVASVLLAAQLTGIAEAARDLAVAYASTRQQFGRPIGGFQAVKHQCADMAVACEAAYSMVKLAALCVAEAAVDASFAAASAKLVAVQAALGTSRATIQVHGGMGITHDCLAHFFLKRVHILEAVGGGLREQQARVLRAAID